MAAAAATSARVMRAVFMSWSHGVVQEWALELVVSRHTDPGLKYHPPARPGPAMGTLAQAALKMMERARVSRKGSEFQFQR